MTKHLTVALAFALTLACTSTVSAFSRDDLNACLHGDEAVCERLEAAHKMACANTPEHEDCAMFNVD